MLGVVGHIGTGHQVQVGEGSIETLAGAGVELAERGVGRASAFTLSYADC